MDRNWVTVILIISLIQILIHGLPLNAPSDDIELSTYTKLVNAKQLRVSINNQINLLQQMGQQLDELIFQEISDITESDKLNVDNYNLYKAKLTSLRINFTDLSAEYSKFNDNNIHSIKERSVNLLNEVNLLHENLDDKTRKGLQLICQYVGDEDIVTAFNNLRNDTIELDAKIVDTEQLFIGNNTIEAIKQKDYESAEHLLKQIIDDNRIMKITNKVYSGNANNFYIILKFGDFISNSTKSFIIFKELNKEMRANKDISISKIIALVNSLTNLINKLGDDKITEAMDLVDHLKSDLKIFGIMHLTDVIENNYVKDCNLKLLENIYILDSNLTLDIFYQAYLDNDNDPDIVNKFQDIFKLVINDYLNDASKLFNKIRFIRKFFLKINHPKSANDCFASVRDNDQVTQNIKNILFAEKVCMHRGERSTYLRSSDSLNNNLYRVYTYLAQDYIPYEFWRLIYQYDDAYKIQSNEFKEFYLDVDTNSTVEGGNHKVYITNEPFLKNYIWKLEVKDDYILIKNINNNEYLYTGLYTEVAYTSVLDRGNDSLYKWQIQDCSAMQ